MQISRSQKQTKFDDSITLLSVIAGGGVPSLAHQLRSARWEISKFFSRPIYFFLSIDKISKLATKQTEILKWIPIERSRENIVNRYYTIIRKNWSRRSFVRRPKNVPKEFFIFAERFLASRKLYS